MTEQEIKQKISDCDRQISSAYNNLRSAARDVGSRGYQSAQSARSSAVSEASGDKLKKTLLPLLITLFGFFMFGASWFLGLAMIIGGVVLAYNLNQKADAEKRRIEQEYNNMVSTAEYQQKNLNSVLDNNAKI